jgi:hypothetical protein
MPELQPDLETETVHAVERMTMHAAEVTLFGTTARLSCLPRVIMTRTIDLICAPRLMSTDCRGALVPRR